MNTVKYQALREFLNEQIEDEEAINWNEDKEIPKDVKRHMIKKQQRTILRLNQLMDLVHAAAQEKD